MKSQLLSSSFGRITDFNGGRTKQEVKQMETLRFLQNHVASSHKQIHKQVEGVFNQKSLIQLREKLLSLDAEQCSEYVHTGISICCQESGCIKLKFNQMKWECKLWFKGKISI